MIHITSPSDSAIAYSVLRDSEMMKHADPEMVKDLKRELRKYLHKPIREDRRCIYEDNYGYYIMLIQFPDSVKNLEDAEEYFDEFERMEYIPSQYDCTGQHSTRGHKIFKRQGRFWCYHSIAVDC